MVFYVQNKTKVMNALQAIHKGITYEHKEEDLLK